MKLRMLAFHSQFEYCMAASMFVLGGEIGVYSTICAGNLVRMRLTTGRWHVPDPRIHTIDMVTSYGVWLLMIGTACFAVTIGYQRLKHLARKTSTRL